MIRFPLMSYSLLIKIAPSNCFGNTRNIARESAIVREWWSDVAHSCERSLDTATSLQWTALLQTFSRCKQLDGEQVFRKIDDRAQLQRTGHSHGHVIFFSAGGCDVVNAGRMSEHARFIHQRGSCDMRDHKPRFHSGPLRKKCRKTLAFIWINKAIGAAFAHAHQISDRDRSVIERKPKWRSVKIPARNHVTGFAKHEQIGRASCRERV